jgi:hypothetical protein
LIQQIEPPASIEESKTAGGATPAVGYIKGNETNRCYIPPEGGALKRTFGSEGMVSISFRASFPNLDEIYLFYLTG